MAVQRDLTRLRSGKPTAEEIDYQYEMRLLEREIEFQQESLGTIQSLYYAGALPRADLENKQKALDKLLLEKEQKEARYAETKKTSDEDLAALIASLEGSLTKTNLSIAQSELELDKAGYDLSKTLASKISEEIIRGERPGILLSLAIKRNAYVSQGAKIATIGLKENRFFTEISVASENARFIGIGDETEITYSDISEKIVGTVTDIKPDGDNLRIRIGIQSELLAGGEYVKIVFKKITEEYPCVIPNEDVIEDSFSNYVWVAAVSFGPMGTEYYAVKMKIMLEDRDENYTAVVSGLNEFNPVILTTSEDLKPNTRIQMLSN